MTAVEKFTFTSNCGEDHETLNQAFDRYNALVFGHSVPNATDVVLGSVKLMVASCSEEYPQITTGKKNFQNPSCWSTLSTF